MDKDNGCERHRQRSYLCFRSVDTILLRMELCIYKIQCVSQRITFKGKLLCVSMCVCKYVNSFVFLNDNEKSFIWEYQSEIYFHTHKNTPTRKIRNFMGIK